jgi:hypothetical protein
MGEPGPLPAVVGLAWILSCRYRPFGLPKGAGSVVKAHPAEVMLLCARRGQAEEDHESEAGQAAAAGGGRGEHDVPAARIRRGCQWGS